MRSSRDTLDLKVPDTFSRSEDNAAQKKPKRRRLQFRLRTLLIGVALVSVLLGWFGKKLYESRRQAAVVHGIVAAGGRVYYDYEVADDAQSTTPFLPEWICELAGVNLFANVVHVSIPYNGSDDLLVEIAKMRSVNTVRCEYSKVTDEGLTHLKPLSELRCLVLDGTAITDNGLKHLATACPDIQVLVLSQTRITSNGIRDLLPLKRLTHLWIDRTPVDDLAVPCLKQMRQLRELVETNVSDEAAEELRKALPNCEIWQSDDPNADQ